MVALLSVSSAQAESVNAQPDVPDEEWLGTSEFVAEAIEEESAVDDAAITELDEAAWPETGTVDLETPSSGDTAVSLTPVSEEQFQEWEVPPFLQQGTASDEETAAENRLHTEPEPWVDPARPPTEPEGADDAPEGSTPHEPGQSPETEVEESPEQDGGRNEGSEETALQDEPVPVAPEPVVDAALEILDPQTAEAAGINGLAMRLTRTDDVQAPGPVEVELDYGDFASAFGGDYGARLRLIALDECALESEPSEDCRAAYDLGSVNEFSAQTLSAVAPATSSGVTLAAVPEADGNSGNYQASELAPSASWEVGLQTGDFSWSYPLDTPDVAGGLAPSMALSYSSGSIDGRTASTNNQASWIGEGFNYHPGFIERSYIPCAEDGQKDPNKTGDQCWRRQNATLSLNGMSSELLLDEDDTWRLRSDDGSKVERLTGATNGDNDGEYWKVTTPDGTQYFFGRNRLPGWTSGDPETDSAWTVPVYGNDSGEPCHKSSFSDSWCQQAWRWNLDYVVDVHGNVMTLNYAKEKNHYARNMGTVSTPYDRGGYLRRIDYGLRSDDVYATAPARVVFTTGERCLATDSFDCAPEKREKANATRWPDVPQDQECESGKKCTGNYSPTIWSTKKLDKVTTQYHDGTEYVPIDSWALTHKFPAPGDGTDPALWLDSITHTGHVGGNLATPALTFAGTPMPNRVDSTSDGVAPMNKWRITAVYSESGGQLDVLYSQPECAPGETPQPHSNTKLCYPVRWVPSGRGDDDITDWFHKYTVTQVTEVDLVTDQPDIVTTYDYQGGAAWRHADADGFTKDDRRTWSQWRGYETVLVNTGVEGQTRSEEEHRFFRGMHGDKQPSGTRSVEVTDSEGTEHTDHDHLYGQTLETLTRNGPGGEVVEKTIAIPWHHRTASRTYSWGTLTADIVRTASERTYTPTADGGWRQHRMDTTHDTLGMPTEVFDHGDTSVAGDEQCSRTTYVRNTGKNMLGLVSRQEALAVGCDSTPSYPDDLILDIRTAYDGGSVGTEPTRGLDTRSERVEDYTDGTPVYQTVQTSTYDSYGRQLTQTDADDNTIAYEFASAVTGGPATTLKVTNPLGHVATTQMEPARSLPVTETDANGRKTELSYDPLGRLTQVWLADRDRSRGVDPSLKFAYHINKDKASYATTSTLNPQGGYTTAYQIYDGLLRPRQTQAPTNEGGRLVSDTLHDHRGLQTQSRTAYPTRGEPGGDIVTVNNTDDVPRWERTVHDGAGRPVHAISMSRGVEQWRITTEYKGEQTLMTAPEGGVGTTTVTDIRGNTTELRHHHGREPVGGYDELTYTYNVRNDLATVTDAEGNTWSNTYDLMGRKVSTTDPDTGTTAFAYDELDRLVSRTDARDHTLAYVHDALGRTVSLHDDSPEGDKRADWVYDTLAKGELTSATRYDEGNAYTTRVVAYDQLYRPVTSDVIIPVAETGVAGTYRFTTRYNPDGSIRNQVMPAVGGLDVENVSYAYNVLGQMTRVAGEGTYIDSAHYSSIGNLAQRSFHREGTRDRKTWATWDYDEATNRVKWASVVPEIGNGSLLHQHYSYDDAGNILSIRDEPSDPDRPSDVQCYTYDHRRQLDQVWTPDATGEDACVADPTVAGLGGAAPYWHTYTYDAIGNRVTETKHGIGGETTRSYTRPDAGQPQPHALTQVEEQGPAGGRLEEYAYDDSGNMVSRITASADQVLEWDAEGKLTTVGDADLGITTYLYDADGQRLIRRSPTTTTLYLPGTELHFERQSLLRTALRYYQHAGETVAVRDSEGKVSWIYGDHHGTGQLAIDSATGEVTQRRFTAFGDDRGGGTGQWPDERGFVGGTNDESTGLTQLGARAYDAAIGRFISVDPVLDLTDPQQMHGYAYANNNPVTYTDPDGLKVRKFLSGLKSRFSSMKNKVSNGARRTWNSKPFRNIRSNIRQRATNFSNKTYNTVRSIYRRVPHRDKILNFTAGAHRTLNTFSPATMVTEWAFTKIGLPSQQEIYAQLGADSSSGAYRLGEAVPELLVPGGWAVRGARGAANLVGSLRDDRKDDALSCALGNSFVRGTRVLMADGSHKPIEDVKIGDQVWASDPETGEEGPRTVLATIVGEGVKTLVEITVDTATQIDAGTLDPGDLPDGPSRPGPTVLGDAVIATDGHPFWVPLLGEWVDAVDLIPGMWFLSSEGTLVQVAGTRVWTEPERVYNLTVQDLHTYYVMTGAVATLVHNCQFSDRAKEIWKAEPSEYVRKNVSTVALFRASTPTGQQVDLIAGSGSGLTPAQMSAPLRRGRCVCRTSPARVLNRIFFFICRRIIIRSSLAGLLEMCAEIGVIRGCKILVVP
ncbi:RHS repeat-associated core domain-containing protein [Nocardiopsis tropica]|nr:RHS repeat-associated core domain-containing protein [Nocardiopsis tropica]